MFMFRSDVHSLPLTLSSKIQNHHLNRLAIVYLRQSTPHQVVDHPESTARQHTLVDRGPNHRARLEPGTCAGHRVQVTAIGNWDLSHRSRRRCLGGYSHREQ